jgi:hypothetical protein
MSFVCAFVNVIACQSAASPARIADARKRANCVGALRMHVTIMYLLDALVNVIAHGAVLSFG